jgi:hypothetical protein
MEDTQFDFLKMYIEKILDDAGFDKMTEETRAQYVPQFMAEAQRRVGLALMPHLDSDATDDLEKILKNDQLSSGVMQEFWKKHVPDFEVILQKTLADFSVELKQTLAEIS